MCLSYFWKLPFATPFRKDIFQSCWYSFTSDIINIWFEAFGTMEFHSITVILGAIYRKWFTLSHDVEIRGSFGGQLPYQNLSQFAYSLHVTTAISSNSGNKLFGMCAVSPNIDPQLLPKFHHFQIHFPCAVFSNLRQRRSFHEVHFQPFNLVSSLSLKAGR